MGRLIQLGACAYVDVDSIQRLEMVEVKLKRDRYRIHVIMKEGKDYIIDHVYTGSNIRAAILDYVREIHKLRGL